MGNLITKAALLAPRLKHEDVDAPELGGLIRLRELTTGEIEAVRESAKAKPGEFDARQGARLLACAIVGEDGLRLLSDDEAGELMKLPVSTTQRLLKVLNRLNGLEGSPPEKN